MEIGTRPGIRKEVWWCLGNFIDEATTEFKTEVRLARAKQSDSNTSSI